MEAHPLSLETPVLALGRAAINRFGQAAARKLALAVASISAKADPAEATVEDILNYLPMRYEDRSNMVRIRDLSDGMEAALELHVRVAGGFQVGKSRSRRQPQLFIFEVTASDPTQSGKPVVIWWFVSGSNAQRIVTYNRQRFSRGARFVAYGKWEWDGRRNTFSLRLNKADELEMLPGIWIPEHSLLSHADETSSVLVAAVDSTEEEEVSTGEEQREESLETAMDEDTDPGLEAIHVGRRVPVYRKLGELRSKRLREIMHALLEKLPDESITETLPRDLRSRQHLIGRAEAIRRIHFPTEDVSLADYEKARSPAHLRLIFEEFFWLALAIAIRRGERTKEPKGAAISITDNTNAAIRSILPFTLTNAQEGAINSIFEDMQSGAPMNRLLQGDVGSGKTIVAVLAMLAAMKNGYQTALMSPTEILAEQHARNLKQLLASTQYRVELLTGSLRVAEKRRIHSALAQGDVDACVGTHALIQESVIFNKLGLVVIDEQHRFGVLQRAEIRARGFNPDVLVMTATPIPRSLAMTAYGDLDVSVIDELPPGRTPIRTVVVGEDQRVGVYKGVDREVRGGRQAYVIYPLVEESEKMDLKDATRMFEHLRDRVFPHFSIGLLHGKMKSADKEEAMRRFVSGATQVLVATTIVEVGVDVPNACVMVIEHAERFGLSQLHQLRGRVGRGTGKSFCVLLASDKQTSVARERLGIMEETSDGFRIAEKDLELRGPGELMGTKQSGIPTFRIGNLVRDVQILEKARREADYYVNMKRTTPDTSRLVRRVRSDPKFGLAAIG